ncbi:EsaB/YukD family protein [Streptomyces sp. ODS28]|uniref:EsaB/YukD family protein n=1 Tax=Streptomyces sp. ODS28 TaxID=3136688 RepID=UPI0031E8F237
MPDERCRVTVIGERKSVDLALPVRTPIAEYAPRLAGMCGEEESEAMPPVWSLAPAGAMPLAPGDSLEQAGVLDGTVLYLRDCRAEEDLDPSVTDLDDQVSAANEGTLPWNARNRALSVLVCGLFGSVLAAGALSLRQQAGPAVVMFWLIGLASALTAWYATRKSWPVPSAVRQIMALAAVPMVAAAGIGLPFDGPVAGPALATASLVLGAIAALLALPAVSTVVVMIFATTAMVLTIPLAVLGADRSASAAVVAVVVLLLFRVLPRVASQIAVLAPGGQPDRPMRESDEVSAAVRRSNRLLAFLTTVLAVVLGTCFVLLCLSENAYAFGLLGCASTAVLLEAGAARMLPAVGPMLAVGTVGLVALFARLPEVLFGEPVPGALVAFGAGVVLTACGIGMAFRAAVRTVDLTERPKWLTGLASFLAMVCVPLAVGVFGVFEGLMNLGGSL